MGCGAGKTHGAASVFGSFGSARDTVAHQPAAGCRNTVTIRVLRSVVDVLVRMDGDAQTVESRRQLVRLRAADGRRGEPVRRPTPPVHY